MNKLDAAAMIARAEKTTGLSDWGGDEFREPLALMVNAINEEGHLNADGYVRAEKRILQRLVQRLKVIEDRKLWPEIAEQKIVGPVMVVGLPRAGTTYTHSLLGADPANIAPLGWQFMVPSPPPNMPTIDHSAQIREAQAIEEEQLWTRPDIRALHDFNPLHPEECNRALEMTFHSMSYMGYWNMPSYFVELTRDATPAYEFHKKVLQACQLGATGSRWVLKAPEHTTQLPSLFNVFPDAMLVQNHRDPAKVMASLVSIMSGLRNLSTDDKIKMTREYVLMQMGAFATAQEQLIELRKDSAINSRFIDVHYLDLERDPLGVMENIYRRTGMDFNQRAQQGIRNWIETNRKGKHGKHKYSLADVGVTADEVHEMYKNYLDYFHIEHEATST